MIEAKGITKSFGNFQALKGIDMRIEKGEIISIVGASGAGKTTLLQIIGTLSRPDTGSVFMNEINISQLNERQLARFRNKNIGFVFQFHHLLPEFTALENICIPGFIANNPRLEVEHRAKELLGFLNVLDRSNNKPKQLSGGENQRVAIARALINNPKVVLADEPTGNLDSANTQEFFSLLLSLRERFNQTFVIVTHNTELANVSDRIFVMQDGKIIDEVTTIKHITDFKSKN
ncbi:MAG: lipoprotein-releasing system ATP-binding protein LolD [Bacteroidetes bacterium CG02_land_8_20_14_3_00_31_25]|nr:ABC transporter ATP-binding protein [Bacteroidota bacterium]PIV62755.1 MAG: lipoprotein-releasing system ATP-binding protein LolD [Bacteroidetes bacterium CG02_land_8_20_14_3_00_31_25]PIX33000.1 MAG: lipoprotein-releasing system ATP-binding protein LolD [Bacteroidetes bacterium CG_4_8_14_3_um_filter_31_14]PIY04763.1 MAG: lipoprotein-releasing system ATP-binding protein LolD [Bacteroidetes bacterium CG_4_10_14_3_um_filter_31_20]